MCFLFLGFADRVLRGVEFLVIRERLQATYSTCTDLISVAHDLSIQPPRIIRLRTENCTEVDPAGFPMETRSSEVVSLRWVRRGVRTPMPATIELARLLGSWAKSTTVQKDRLVGKMTGRTILSMGGSHRRRKKTVVSLIRRVLSSTPERMNTIPVDFFRSKVRSLLRPGGTWLRGWMIPSMLRLNSTRQEQPLQGVSAKALTKHDP